MGIYNFAEITYEPWQFLYMFIIGCSGLIMISGLIANLHRHLPGAIPTSLLAISGLGILLLLNPISLTIAYFLHITLLITAPIGATLIATTFTLFGSWSFWYTILGSRIRM